jgi:hypothetical protein
MNMFTRGLLLVALLGAVAAGGCNAKKVDVAAKKAAEAAEVKGFLLNVAEILKQEAKEAISAPVPGPVAL